MNSRILLAVSVPAIIALGGVGSPLARASSVDVDYGTVSAVTPIKASEINVDKEDLSMIGGGLAGGAFGYLLNKGGRKTTKAFNIIAGSLAGGAIGKNVAKDEGKEGEKDKSEGNVYKYSVDLLDGSSASITTEQARIDVGDCVSVERGKSANIRRVSQVHCRGGDGKPAEEHLKEAQECEAAKAALVSAEMSEEELQAAVRKARRLCEE